MKFTKPALAIQQQIDRLIDRGMAVPDQDLARHYLQHVSYYRLRAYWLPFEVAPDVEGEHKFGEGTSFPDVLALYVFDRQLRLLVMDAIERIEVSFRGAWAHHMAMTYGPHGYLDAALYSRSDQFARSLTALLDEIDRSRDTFIKHYKTKYDDPEHPPVWMVSEILTLGQLSKWYGNLKARSDRRNIALSFGLDERVLASLVHHLSYVRNICAHHGRLWNKQFTVTMMLPKSPTGLWTSLNPAADRNLYNTLVLLGHLIAIVAPGSNWRWKLIDLVDSCAHADEVAMGFPEDWRDRLFWAVGKEEVAAWRSTKS